jgi:hypothetical protein
MRGLRVWIPLIVLVPASIIVASLVWQKDVRATFTLSRSPINPGHARLDVSGFTPSGEEITKAPPSRSTLPATAHERDDVGCKGVANVGTPFSRATWLP